MGVLLSSLPRQAREESTATKENNFCNCTFISTDVNLIIIGYLTKRQDEVQPSISTLLGSLPFFSDFSHENIEA